MSYISMLYCKIKRLGKSLNREFTTTSGPPILAKPSIFHGFCSFTSVIPWSNSETNFTIGVYFCWFTVCYAHLINLPYLWCHQMRNFVIKNQNNPISNNRTGIGVDVSGVLGSLLITIRSQTNPIQKTSDENMMWAFSRLLVCWMVESGVPIPWVAIGAPHLGQAVAAVETCEPHSWHFTRAILIP